MSQPDARHPASGDSNIRLHIGCGPHRFDGWVNIDNRPHEGVDLVHDVRHGLPFERVGLIFAEHFIEHLDYLEAEKWLRECRRVLRDDGILRLSTPNLDWVWASHYKRALAPEEEILACFGINRAFRGWGHRFLYNFATLSAALRAAGFSNAARCEYGESRHEALRGLERHEKNPDFDGLSHIVIVEAWGTGGNAPQLFDEPRAWYLRDLAAE